MNKLAVFVEGQTEQIFVEKLLIEIAGKNNIHIKLIRGKSPRRQLYFNHADNEREYFAYVIDCHGDSTVKSYIIENYDGLVNQGYSSIIGIRDVYPIERTEIPKLRQRLFYGARTKPVVPVFILSVMEIEAWFLAEHTHFQKIHSRLTIDRIKAEFNFDPSQDNMELRDHPAQDLHEIYSLEDRAYRKKEYHTKRTVEALDYANIYLSLRSKLHAIEELSLEIDRFME